VSLRTDAASSYWRWGVAAALLMAAIIVPFVIWGEALEQAVNADFWSGRTAVAIAFIGAALLAADVVLPVPSSLVGTILGTALGLFAGTLVGAAGLTAGCLCGYALGRAIGVRTAKFVGEAELRRATAWLTRYGIAALVVCRAVPVLAEASVIAAGALRMPALPVFGATALSNLGISAVYATAGASASGGWTFLLAFLTAMGVPAAVLVLAKVIERSWRA
jgi:membrane protein DedA with SNARE-associated domain